jgi:hypothetical protein
VHEHKLLSFSASGSSQKSQMVGQKSNVVTRPTAFQNKGCSLSMRLLDLIRKPALSSAEMRVKLERLRAADPRPRGGELELRRRELLFSRSEKDVDRIEAEIAQNLCDTERYETAVAELEKQVTQAELAEQPAALTSERDAAEAEAEATGAELKREYPGLAKALVKLLTRLKSAEAAVIAVNGKLILAGREGELLHSVEPRFPRLCGGSTPRPHFFAGWGGVRGTR